jgi:1-acyl-sn-glycerol-3-phosphate acyltransferase
MWALAACALMAGVVLRRWRRSGRKLVDFLGLGCVYVYARLWHGCTYHGLPPVPVQGAAILIANHTCSADPAFLQAAFARPLSFLIAHEYYESLPRLRGLFEYIGSVPVVRDGRDVRAVRLALRRLSAGRLVCIFPEGGLSAAGRQRLRHGKGGAALLALRSRAPVIPAYISGGPQHSHVPRAWLLPSRVRVTFGPAVDLSAYDGRPINRRLIEEVTALLMSQIAALQPKPKDHKPRR